MATRVPAIQVTTSGKRKQLKESSTSQYWFQIPLKYLYELVRYTYMNSFQTPLPVPQMKKKTKKKNEKNNKRTPPPPKKTNNIGQDIAWRWQRWRNTGNAVNTYTWIPTSNDWTL